MSETTAERICAEGRRLIMSRGYNGFSYADVAEAVGIRKASIHHHFPNKSDLAIAIVEQSRAFIGQQRTALEQGDMAAIDALRAYTSYWAQCIADDSAPFCVAAILAAELRSLPQALGDAVERHFADLSRWVRELLATGAQDGSVTLHRTVEEEADGFVAAIYGAMLCARAFGDPGRFVTMTDTLLARLVRLY